MIKGAGVAIEAVDNRRNRIGGAREAANNGSNRARGGGREAVNIRSNIIGGAREAVNNTSDRAGGRGGQRG